MMVVAAVALAAVAMAGSGAAAVLAATYLYSPLLTGLSYTTPQHTTHWTCRARVVPLPPLQVRRYLDELHNKRMSPYERIELLEAIRAQVGWGFFGGGWSDPPGGWG